MHVALNATTNVHRHGSARSVGVFLCHTDECHTDCFLQWRKDRAQ